MLYSTIRYIILCSINTVQYSTLHYGNAFIRTKEVGKYLIYYILLNYLFV